MKDRGTLVLFTFKLLTNWCIWPFPNNYLQNLVEIFKFYKKIRLNWMHKVF